MSGPDACTLHLPGAEGYAAIPLCGVHWQEEIAASGGVSAQGRLLAKRLVRVYLPATAPVPRDLPRLAGTAYLTRQTGAEAEEVFTLTAAALCQFGSPALHHWELLAE